MPLLEIENLTKAYQTPEGESLTVLDVEHFELEAGQQRALQGASGSGKTTFLHIIAGILRPDAGSVRIGGTEVTTLSEAARDRFRANHLGYVFQTFNLLQGYTALENVTLAMRFGSGADTAHATALLSRVGLEDRLSHRPRQLSSGQQQRVAVARALANRPDLVIADEPTGNLDWSSATETLNMIRNACEESGTALLLVSHDPNVLSQFDNVVPFAEINRAARDHREVSTLA